jgi:HSP20 family molecular chaperone IbpA
MSELTTVREINGSASAKAYHRRAVAPPVDVFENADELLLVADLPGVSSNGLDLRFENDTLTLEAKRPAPAKDESPALLREYEEVDFATTFRIPAGIDTAAISAETKNGALIVHLPKSPSARARKITVR